MTTAHRPTWDAAVAGTKRGESDLGKLSLQWSSRDAPSHLKLKVRSVVDTKNKAELKRKLEEKEKAAARQALKKTAGNEHLDDEEIEKKRLKFEQLDKDDPLDSSSASEDDDSSDEDDTEQLMAELAKIKRERAEEEEKKKKEQAEQNERIKTEKMLHGNPLMDIANKIAGDSNDPTESVQVKRRWDDDVIFKNCAKSEEHKEEKRFVNDTLRSDFHRRFIERYFNNGSNFISP